MKAANKISPSIIILSGIVLLTCSLCLPVQAQTKVRKSTKIEKLHLLSEKFHDAFFRNYNIAVEKAKQNGWPVRLDLPNGSAMEIRALDRRGMPIYVVTENLIAAHTVSTSLVWPGGPTGFGLDGSGMVVGMWDAGAIRTTHQEFTGRAFKSDAAYTVNNHSTHVAGTIIAHGIDSNSKGMAFEATLESYDWNNDNAEMAAAAANGLLLSNHSYGQAIGWHYYNNFWYWLGDITFSTTEDYTFGFYNNYSSAWDEISYDAPYYLIVRAAGNERGSGPAPGTGHNYWAGDRWIYSTAVREKDGGADGYDCLDAESVPKNILTVGSVNDIPGGYSDPSQVVVASSSSWGPTDDGRIKPDIVANGIGLYSTSSASDNAYATMSGTSMAAPNATGSLVLLQQLYQDLHNGNPMQSATLKGLVIHTADEAGTATGPDYQFGWGLLNTAKAAGVISDETNGWDDNLIQELTLQEGSEYSIQVSSAGIEPLLVTICWTDPAAAPPSPALNSRLKMLVNDLDLRVSDQNDTFYPWILDPDNPSDPATPGDNITDNAEQVYVQNPVAGIYTIAVNHKGTLSGGSQDFALIMSGASYSETLTITSPNGGGNWIAGTRHAITWNSMNAGDSLKIEFSTDGGSKWSNITTSTANTGDYNWLVADSVSSSCLIKISDLADGQPTDQSDTDFSIVPLGSVVDLSIQNLTDRLFLNWQTIQGATAYNLYRDTSPLFVPTGSNFLAAVSTTFYFDIDNEISNNVIGDVNTNYYYIVRAANSVTESVNSKRVGEFDFGLISNNNGNANEIAVCLWDGTMNHASDLMSAIPNSFSVGYWNAASQRYMNFLPSNPLTNFQIEAGHAYQVKVSANSVFTLVGEMVTASFDLTTTPSTDFNAIILPLTMTDISDANQLLNTVPNCNSVAYWDAVNQRFFQYCPVFPQTNFAVKPGFAYYVNVTLKSTWP